MDVYFAILRMSLTGSVVIGLVLLLRLCLKRAPRTLSHFLWLPVLLQLLIPDIPEISFSIVPKIPDFAANYQLHGYDISFGSAAIAATEVVGDALNGGMGIQHVKLNTPDQLYGNVVSTDWRSVVLLFSAYLWVIGVAVLLLCGVISYLKLHKKLDEAVPIEKNVYLCDRIDTPFVMGIFPLKIYLPCGLSETDRMLILKHERYHIRMFHPYLRMIAYLTLCLHWFNPLCWLAFRLSAKDMEMSCDENVLLKLEKDLRAEYAEALLRVAVGKKRYFAAWTAFGESDTKQRVKNVMRYRKPSRYLLILLLIVIAALCVFLSTVRVSERQTVVAGSDYTLEQVLYDPAGKMPKGNTFCVTADDWLYIAPSDMEGGYRPVGKLQRIDLDRDKLLSYAPKEWRGKKPGRITDARITDLDGGDNYLVLQTQSGDTLIGYLWVDLSEQNDPYSDDSNFFWLAKAESCWKEGHINTNFFARSLRNTVGANVDTFAFHENETLIPGYLIVGFRADSDTEIVAEMTDLGFAVFRRYGSGYRLVDWHLYQDAALQDGVYMAKDPAICREYTDAPQTKRNSFDLVFVTSENIREIEWQDENGDLLAWETYCTSPGMYLLSWETKAKAKEVTLVCHEVIRDDAYAD